MTTKNMGQEGFSWWVGIVADLMDPLKLGRARVRVYGDHQGLDTEDLPWAISLLPITSASSNQIGISPTGMIIGSTVMGMYLDGNEKQKPLILGTLAQIPDLDPEKHDVSKLAREQNSIQKTQLGPEPASAYAAKYPDNKVMQSKSGHVIEIDDTEGQERLHFYHKAGTYTEINKDGRRVDKTEADQITVVKGSYKSYIKGSADIKYKDKVDVNLNGDLNITAQQISLNADIINITCTSFTVNGVDYSTLLSLA